MWKPRVVKDRLLGLWRVVGSGRHYRSWREAYDEARRDAARFAGRETPC